MRKGETLNLKRCRLFNNDECGLSIKASKCSVFNCVVRENVEIGIVSDDSKDVFIGRNNVFDNGQLGLYIMNSDVDISENNVFDNGSWGIYTQKNLRCNIALNRVFRNKVRGVRVGYRAAGKELSPCVVEMNEIYDNIGPGLVEDAFAYEKQELLRKNLGQSYFVSPDYFQRAKCQDNEIYNNKESKNVSKLNQIGAESVLPLGIATKFAKRIIGKNIGRYAKFYVKSRACCSLPCRGLGTMV